MKKGIKKEEFSKRETITIRGIILPADWDEEGNIIKVLLSTPEEEEYLLLTDFKKEDLLTYLRKTVEVTGSITADGKKQNIIVETFSVKESG